LIVERRDMNNNAVSPKKVFDIAFHLFLDSTLNYLIRKVGRGIRSTQYLWKKKNVFLAISYRVCAGSSCAAHLIIGFILVGSGAKNPESDAY
jgi:hypothetical protein